MAYETTSIDHIIQKEIPEFETVFRKALGVGIDQQTFAEIAAELPLKTPNIIERQRHAKWLYNHAIEALKNSNSYDALRKLLVSELKKESPPAWASAVAKALKIIDGSFPQRLQFTTSDDIIASLTERESQIMRDRYGIDAADDLPASKKTHPTRNGVPIINGHTLEETGRKFSVTASRIRLIEARALRKLRNPLRAGPFMAILKKKSTPEGVWNLAKAVFGTEMTAELEAVNPQRKKIPEIRQQPHKPEP